MDKQFSPEELRQYADGELPEELRAQYPVAKQPDLEAPANHDYSIPLVEADIQGKRDIFLIFAAVRTIASFFIIMSFLAKLTLSLPNLSLPFAEGPLFIVFPVTFGCVGLFWGMLSLLRYLDW